MLAVFRDQRCATFYVANFSVVSCGAIQSALLVCCYILAMLSDIAFQSALYTLRGATLFGYSVRLVL